MYLIHGSLLSFFTISKISTPKLSLKKLEEHNSTSILKKLQLLKKHLILIKKIMEYKENFKSH